jgi:hypothetical protein
MVSSSYQPSKQDQKMGQAIISIKNGSTSTTTTTRTTDYSNKNKPQQQQQHLLK